MAEPVPDHTAPLKAASDLTACLTEAAGKNRAMLEEMAQFTRDESLRFFQRRLDRATAAIGKLQEAHSAAGMIGVQQEWLRDLFQDYAAQQMRLAGLMRALTQDAFDRCHQVAGMGLRSMREAAGAMSGQMREAAEEVQVTAEEMAAMPGEMADDMRYTAETQH